GAGAAISRPESSQRTSPMAAPAADFQSLQPPLAGGVFSIEQAAGSAAAGTPLRQFAGRHRIGVEEALRGVAAEFAQPLELGLRFDTFGDGTDAQFPGQFNDGLGEQV